MKLSKIYGIALATAMGVSLAGCNDYLDITPPSQVTPETYFNNADQLGAYTINFYKNSKDVEGNRGNNLFPSFGSGGSSYGLFTDDDQGTDNEGGTNDRFFDGTSKTKVGATGGGWSFGTINDINYFLEVNVPKYEAGQIQGSEEAIRHYLGEGYMIRATEYFGKLRDLGDFPIVTTTLPLDKTKLIEASKRQPRNLVARFILGDLDKAIELLSDGAQTGGRNRITRDVALLFKARVALYEATFEKYFAGTPFVPDRNAGWPGAQADYLKDFTYDNATEVAFFLDQALAASKAVADAHPTLTANNKTMLGASATSFPSNPYYNLFSTTTPETFDEALMYRSYDLDISGGHCLNQYIKGGKGYTQEFANCFLMDNGLPIYAPGSGYAGDDLVGDTKKNRDWRWRLFMKAPNEYVYADNPDIRIGEGKKNQDDPEYFVPALQGGPKIQCTTSTGYTKGKGWSTNSTFTKGGWDLTAAIIFRSAEAYLTYIEAAWEKYGDGLDADAWTYWGKLRERAGLPADAHITINATDLDKEEETSHDFALYSGGRRITSKVLYNIRRERRCEFISEGLRWDDLIRWRALDQLKDKRYFKHGCKIFGPMKDYYGNRMARKTMYMWDNKDPKKNNLSSPDDIEGGLNGDARYFSLLRVSSDSEWYASGFSWRLAHYLSPIAESHFIESSTNSDGADSPIYQNPYWSTEKDTPAIQ